MGISLWWWWGSLLGLGGAGGGCPWPGAVPIKGPDRFRPPEARTAPGHSGRLVAPWLLQCNSLVPGWGGAVRHKGRGGALFCAVPCQ